MVNLVSVVLSGNSLQGKGLGKEIDAADAVVRMHDYHLYHNKEDHGKRFDYGVLPGPWFGKALETVKNPPQKNWWVYTLVRQKRKAEYFTHVKGKRALSIISNVDKKYFSRQLAPTRGFLAIELSFKILEADKVTVYGGDSLRAGEPTFYYNGSKHNLSQRHDMSFEKALIADLWGNRITFNL